MVKVTKMITRCTPVKLKAKGVGIGMMPRAEVALVIAAISIRAGVVSPALFSMTVMVVLLTSLVTPPLVELAFKGVPEEK